MPQSKRSTFLIITGLIFLLPLFFVPGGALDFASGKAVLVAIGALAAFLTFAFALWKEGEVAVPRHHLLTVVLLLPAIYLLSALLSTPSSLSLLGYNLEAGTFGFVLLGALLLALGSVVFTDASRALPALFALFGSLAILALFVTIKILSGGTWLVLGNFFGNMGNPLGSWTDLALAFALLALLSTLALGMLPMKRSFKVVLWGAFLLSTALMAVINFSQAFILTLIASVLLFLYFSRVESGFYFHARGEKGERGNAGWWAKPTLLPIILGAVSLVFIINPVISGRTVGERVSGACGVSNTEIRPSFSTTLGISKSVLTERALFGSGPNTFRHDWLAYKPADINVTPFWAVEFPFGAGFIPTQIAATGIIGSILWLAFFGLLLFLSLKALAQVPENRALRFALLSAMTASLFIWAASFLSTPSAPLLLIAFIFTGILLALSPGVRHTLRFREAPASQVAALLLAATVAGALLLGWTEIERTLASFHFKRAVDLAATEGAAIDAVEAELEKAIGFAPLDTYFRALSSLNFSKAQALARATSGTPEENRLKFDEALARSLAAARAAVSENPASYGNWVALGLIYAALVPEPLSIEGAYENAQLAFNEAFKRNPANPELPLLLAQLEISRGNTEAARSYIRNSLALKDNYPDAYLLLAQLEAGAKNLPAAIASAERLAILSPQNAGVKLELGLLKYSNNDFRGAAAALEDALTISPDYANAQYYLALAYTKLGETGKARSLLEALLASNPDSAEVQAALDTLEENSR